MTAYIIIERQYSADLAIEYPDRDAAEHALEHSVFIDGLCEEDCLEAYVLDDDAIMWPDPVEHVIPPDESNSLPLTAAETEQVVRLLTTEDDGVVPVSGVTVPQVEFSVDWVTDGVYAENARQAAEWVWTEKLRRTLPATPDDACVFGVTGPDGFTSIIDLAEET